MLKEFVEAIGSLAILAEQPVLIGDTFNPRKAYLVHNGLVQEKDVAPPLLNSSIDSIESLAAAVETFGPASGSVWYDRQQITVILDNDDRLERVYMRLKLSDQLVAIKKLPRSFDQKSLILFLKRDLRGAIDPLIITPFRQLDFTKREANSGVIKHGDESLGRAVQAAVANAAEIPEFLPVSIRVFSHPELVFRATIMLSVDIDLQRGVIDLTPLPDEIENAFYAAEDYLAGVLESQLELPKFRGVPVMIPARPIRSLTDD